MVVYTVILYIDLKIISSKPSDFTAIQKAVHDFEKDHDFELKTAEAKAKQDKNAKLEYQPPKNEDNEANKPTQGQ